MTRLRLLGAAFIAATFTMACGGAPKPVAQIAASEASIRGANEAGANHVPEATLYLQMARENHAKGLALVEDDENESASSLFIRSQADAELALAIARASRAESDASQAKSRVYDVKEDAR